MSKTGYRLTTIAMLGMVLTATGLLAACTPDSQDSNTSAHEVRTPVPSKVITRTPAEEPQQPSAQETPADTVTTREAPDAAPTVAESGDEPVPSPAASTAPTADDLSASESDIFQRIAACEDLIEWFELREELDQPTPAVQAVLDQKEHELLQESPPIAINEALELADFRWEPETTDVDAEEPATFRITWLFKKQGQIEFEPDHDVLLIVRGWPDKSHLSLFLDRPERDDDRDYFEFNWRLDPSIDAWEAGDYQLVSRDTYKPVPNVPYSVQTFFSEQRKDEDGSWAYVGPYGERAKLPGWFVGFIE